MCGRFTLHAEKEKLERHFEVDLSAVANLRPRYNIAPTQAILTILQAAGERVAQNMHWGLVPSWTRDRSKLPLLINARKETATSKPAFRASFRHKRCLVPADGFYEWQVARPPARGRIPHWISRRDGEPFALAGLWAQWPWPADARTEESGATLRSCTILTMPACPVLGSIHARMPVILLPENERDWLDPRLDFDLDQLQALLVSPPGEQLRFHPVARKVNSVRNDSPDLIQPHDPPSLGFSEPSG